ncbi:hypothetical protein L9F63_011411, partial [Diploptera punctata]
VVLTIRATRSSSESISSSEPSCSPTKRNIGRSDQASVPAKSRMLLSSGPSD